MERKYDVKTDCHTLLENIYSKTEFLRIKTFILNTLLL